MPTAADLATDFYANRDYAHGGGSVTKAEAYELACSGLLLIRPEEIRHGDELLKELQNLKFLQGELDLVRSWLNANSTTTVSTRPPARAVHADFRGFRN